MTNFTHHTEKEILIAVPVSVPSANKWVGRNRWAYRTFKDQWANMVGYQALSGKAHHPDTVFPLPYAKVYIHTHLARGYDFDNLVAGVKPILDVLKKTGVIVDDNPKRISLCVSQEASKERKTEIKIVWKYP